MKYHYSMLKILEKNKRYVSYQTWKHLVESLILSKVDYCNVTLTCRANQWASFYMIGTSVMKELRLNESRYVALYVVSGSIKKTFSVDFVNIYLFPIHFSIAFANICFSRYFFQ